MERKRRWGFTYVESARVTSLVTSVSMTAYQAVKKGKEANCLNNLRQVYIALNICAMDYGALPEARFFPSSASDPRGIHNVLKKYVSNPAIFYCPSIPEELNKSGTNYLWNDLVNRNDLSSLPQGTWIMTEATAVRSDIPPPHTGGYGTLAPDGSATIRRRPPIPEVRSTPAAPAAPETPAAPAAPPAPGTPAAPETPVAPAAPGTPAGPATPGAGLRFRFDAFGPSLEAGAQQVKISVVDESGAPYPLDAPVWVLDLAESLRPETILIQKGTWQGPINFTRPAAENRLVLLGEKNSGASPVFSVTAGPAEKVRLTPAGPARAGEPVKLEIQVTDRFGNPAAFTGKASLASDDPEAKLPAELSLSGPAGPELTFFKAGKRKLRVKISGAAAGELEGETEVAVRPGPLDRFRIDPIRSPQVAGQPFTVFIRSEDRWGNRVPGLELNDPSHTLKPVRESIIAFSRVEEVTITRAGREAAVEVADGLGHTGRSNAFEVLPARPEIIRLEGLPAVLFRGREYRVSASLGDAFGNRIEAAPEKLEITSVTPGFKSVPVPGKTEFLLTFDTVGRQVLTVNERDGQLKLELELFVLEKPESP